MLANFTRHRLLQTAHVVSRATEKPSDENEEEKHFARPAIVPRSLHADDCIILAMQRDPFAHR